MTHTDKKETAQAVSFLTLLTIQMISVIGVLAGIAPANAHFARRQINDHGVDGFFAVERVGPLDVVIADRVWQVDMILLDGL